MMQYNLLDVGLGLNGLLAYDIAYENNPALNTVGIVMGLQF